MGYDYISVVRSYILIKPEKVVRKENVGKRIRLTGNYQMRLSKIDFRQVHGQAEGRERRKRIAGQMRRVQTKVLDLLAT